MILQDNIYIKAQNNSDLFSKTEKYVGFAGELLNADGLCGGYNLMFAAASANKIAKYLIKK